MDFWKAAAVAAQEQADAVKKAAREQVKELKMGALELAEDIYGSAEAFKKKSSGDKELEFKSGPLGFRLDGTLVISVEPGSQADTLGVEGGDRLAAVAGYSVPEFEPDDFEGEQRAMKLVKKWLKEMPRPSTLSFVTVACAEDDLVEDDEAPAPAQAASWSPRAESSGPASADEAAPARGSTPKPRPNGGGSGGGGDEMQALMRLAAEWQDGGAESALPADLQALQDELRREQEERKQLSSELQRSRNARLQANSHLESVQAKYQKRVADLEAQLLSAREETRKAYFAASAGEADNFNALESSEIRNGVLEEEVARLRQALDAAGREASDASSRHASEDEDLHSRLAEAYQSTGAAEQRAEVLARELRGYCEAHEAELEIMRSERADIVRKHEEALGEERRRWREKEEQADKELTEVRQDLELAERRALAAASEAQAAALEASTARLEAARQAGELERGALAGGGEGDEDVEDIPLGASLPSPSAGSDNFALYARIEQLEKRSAALQKKLNARPVVFQSPTDIELGGSRRPSWELSVVAMAGPKAGAFVLVLHTFIDETLRNFTKRLLKRDAWLWMFYAHLLFLYAIAASSYVEVLPLADGSAVDINLKQGEAPTTRR